MKERCQDCSLKQIIGTSQATQDLLVEMQVIAGAGVDTVLVTGDSGTGKELVAGHLYKLMSKGHNTPLVRVNCAALPEALLEEELFGHSKGAFTDARCDKKGLFELADGGCLLLDEIKDNAPSCSECHDGSGQTPDGTKMVPFAALGYQSFPTSAMCSLCHESESMNWDDMHAKHVEDKGLDCVSCHTTPPTGLRASRLSLCADCHDYESETDSQNIHNKHVKESIGCATCHTF